MSTKLSSGQAIKEAFDENSESLKITTVNSFIQFSFDKITRSDFDSTTEDFTYEFEGSVVGIIRVIYTTATKDILISIERIV